MLTLADRPGLTAVDGSPVVGQLYTARRVQSGFLATFAYSAVVTPATVNVRAKIEVSTDGTNWHDVIRFIDQTTIGGAVRIARLPLTAVAAEAAPTQTALSTVAAAAVLSDGGLGEEFFIRAHTMLQTLTGASAQVSIRVSVSARGL